MAGIAYRYSGSVRSLTGAAYTNPTAGTYRLNVRTGSGSNDIMKFGLTTNTSASAYSPKMLLNGNVCYIGRTEGGTASSTRSSSYVSEYRTATRKSTSATSKLYAGARYSVKQTAYYYGNASSQYSNFIIDYPDFYDDGYENLRIVKTISIRDKGAGAVSASLTYLTTQSNYNGKWPIVSMTESITKNNNASFTTSHTFSIISAPQSTNSYFYFQLSRTSLQQHNRYLDPDYEYRGYHGYYYTGPNLADLGTAIECDQAGGAVYYKNINVLMSYFNSNSSYTYYTRSSTYTSSTVTATRSSSYTYANTTHNYNI